VQYRREHPHGRLRDLPELRLFQVRLRRLVKFFE